MSYDLQEVLPSFEELFVVSDLHVGGARGLQLFNEGARFHETVEWMVAQAGDRRAALVCNGDTFDFLALGGTEPLRASDPLGAFEQVQDDGQFPEVLGALKRWLDPEGDRHLVFVPGNHDLELAFPEVQGALRHELGNPSRERVRFSDAGHGFVCTVGSSRVVCIHGHTEDRNNYVDYDDFARVVRRRAWADRQPLEGFAKSFGTHLVTEKLEQLARRWPFVGCLKPEVPLVPLFLLYFDPGLLRDFPRLFGSGWRVGRDELKRRGLLGRGGGAGGAYPAEDLACEVEADFAHGIDPRFVADGEDTAALLGPSSYLPRALCSVRRWPEKVRRDSLRRSLDAFTQDFRTGIPQGDDPAWTLFRDRAGKPVRFFLAGHTHLPRDRTDTAGDRFFNTGAWARLVWLHPGLARKENDAALGTVLEALKGGGPHGRGVAADPCVSAWDRLDACEYEIEVDGDHRKIPLVHPYCYLARIRREDHGAVGDLYAVGANGKPQPWKDVPAAGRIS